MVSESVNLVLEAEKKMAAELEEARVTAKKTDEKAKQKVETLRAEMLKKAAEEQQKIMAGTDEECAAKKAELQKQCEEDRQKLFDDAEPKKKAAVDAVIRLILQN